MSSSVHFSSQTDLWATPIAVFRELDKEFGFDLDVCALPENAKCKRFFTPETDGLSQDWGRSVCWMNPPYGREIGKWIKKAYESAQAGATVVCLIPARTDTAWWHDYVAPGAADIRFIRGRLKFGNGLDRAPFPSVVVVFGVAARRQKQTAITRGSSTRARAAGRWK
jgi:phage N-6-adenine-methyltransferase